VDDTLLQRAQFICSPYDRPSIFFTEVIADELPVWCVDSSGELELYGRVAIDRQLSWLNAVPLYSFGDVLQLHREGPHLLLRIWLPRPYQPERDARMCLLFAG
jgi:hypothetical protein